MMKGEEKLSPYEKAHIRMLNKEALAIYNMNRKLRKKDGSIYIPFEDAKFNWMYNPKEVGWFDDLWNQGVPIKKIAKRMDRKVIEIVLLVMDRNYKGKIKAREGGIWGL